MPVVLSTGLFAVVATVYLAVLFGIGLWARTRVRSAEDFAVAGRRLSWPLASATLFATWFGAGTLLTVADEVRARGLSATTLDPLGAGLCLLLAGVFLAAPLWRMKLFTLADFFRRRFGARAEWLSAAVMVPGYFGWIAAQFVALAQVIHLFAGVPVEVGILVVAVVGAALTLLGGMWSVTATEALQTALLIGGLLWLSAEVFARLGHGTPARGLAAMLATLPRERVRLFAADDAAAFVGWLGVLAAGSLGNLPGQDLTQRMFSARSARTAQVACLVAGAAYLTIGFLPPLLALAADVLTPGAAGRATLPALAGLFLSPATAALFVIVVISAVLSTIQSALLAPAVVLAQNLTPASWRQRFGDLRVERAAVLVVAASSLALALLGASAYGLLEAAYEIGLAGLVVPLLLGVGTRWGGERAALLAMLVGTFVWLPHVLLGWDGFLAPLLAPAGWQLPAALCSAGVSLLAYRLGAIASKR